MKLWHDDIRKPPDDSWVWVRTNDAAKEELITKKVTEVSLDHDLGLHYADENMQDADLLVARDAANQETGLDLVKWMCKTGNIPEKVTIHSWNPPGAEEMARVLAEEGCQAIVEPFSVDSRLDN